MCAWPAASASSPAVREAAEELELAPWRAGNRRLKSTTVISNPVRISEEENMKLSARNQLPAVSQR